VNTVGRRSSRRSGGATSNALSSRARSRWAHRPLLTVLHYVSSAFMYLQCHSYGIVTMALGVRGQFEMIYMYSIARFLCNNWIIDVGSI